MSNQNTPYKVLISDIGRVLNTDVRTFRVHFYLDVPGIPAGKVEHKLDFTEDKVTVGDVANLCGFKDTLNSEVEYVAEVVKDSRILNCADLNGGFKIAANLDTDSIIEQLAESLGSDEMRERLYKAAALQMIDELGDFFLNNNGIPMGDGSNFNLPALLGKLDA
jgi:hypothetical protein